MDTYISQCDFSRKLLAGATDAVLVTAAKSGDHTAFAQLWERHSNKVFRTVYRITGNRDDAEDVLQEAWMKAYAHLKTFEGRASYDGETSRSLDVADQTKGVEEILTRHENAQRLKRAICGLKPRQRKVVEIHQLLDGSIKETADLAGISEGATKSRLSRSLTSLRKALQRKNERALPSPQRTSLSLSMTRR